LHPSFRPLVLVTGILLLVSAACVLGFPGSACGCDDECREHAQSPRGLLAFAVLLLPIAFAASLTPDSFSAAFLQNRGVSQSLAGAAQASEPKAQEPQARERVSNHPRAVSMLDLMLAAQDDWAQKDFDGKLVTLTGRFFPQDAHSFGLVSTLITCCAADAQTLAVRVNMDDPPKWGKLAWVKVVGRVSFSKSGEQNVPIIAAEKITGIPSPEEQYIYPQSRPIKHSRPSHAQ
jgi:uncharacterized repeat protein (TIGR03943 family)